MFESLDEHIKHDTDLETTRTERVVRWMIAFLVTFVVLGVLYYGMRMLD
jgi:hypothetical protein